jgi:PAS domain S-box-containing protein
MHAILGRQLKRAGLQADAPPNDVNAWTSLLQAIDRAYAQADDDRYLLERSLSLSSEEMAELHAQLASERDTISTVICSLAEGVCAIDQSGAILFVNPEARRLLGLGATESPIGTKLVDLVEHATVDQNPLATVLADPAKFKLEDGRFAIGEGSETIVSCSIAPLGHANEGLVVTLRDVTVRTQLEQERADLNRRLLEMSRQAGMAEVASGVLHNVGNVLNSVNVSSTVIADKIRASKIANLARIASLLNDNRTQLDTFFREDPVGMRLPEYIDKLAHHLGEEQQSMLNELTQLRGNIDHISEIVSTQQMYAKTAPAALCEPEQITTLVESALRIVEASLLRHSVTVEREFEALPPVAVDRHHFLQVLINLIANAKRAVTQRAGDDRRITLRVTAVPGKVRICVADNGVGIAPDVLPHIFRHGFTTEPNGHGFGLHSAALAAQAMHGSLSASSDGVNRGAVFTLELPANELNLGIAA